MEMERPLTEFNTDDKDTLTAQANGHWLLMEETNDSPLNGMMLFQYTEINQCDNYFSATEASHGASIVRLPTKLGTSPECSVQQLLDHFFGIHDDSHSGVTAPCTNSLHIAKTKRVILSKDASTVVVKIMGSVWDEGTEKNIKLTDSVAVSNDISLPVRFDQHQIYSLRSILLHIGDTDSHGHFISYSFDSMCGGWYSFNDATVTPLNITEPLTTADVKKNAFLLFYVRQ
ncbi:hypothetical protein HPB50_014243 [Hyalomma asiaticum]|uniref:Uncharacterized protein n=1 Tax=Hyalomma asiaticum TaxID=266040 RepID=A0ACB7RJ93_HYAAI|nr:hypothetical protein HPB50_014243 [Hyalomma asiaticum]